MDADLWAADFNGLAGWAAHEHAEALLVFKRSCPEILNLTASDWRSGRFGGSLSAWQNLARTAADAEDARTFFETHFRVFRVYDRQRPEGLFTGYFEPEADGSRSPNNGFTVPVYRRPDDLVSFPVDVRREFGLSYGRYTSGKPVPYFTRREIEQGALAGRGLEILWLRDRADAFFIHVQGSGRIRLSEGGSMRLSFAAKSGLPYTGIGAILAERRVLSREQLSMQTIRHWMAQHPADALELMWRNESFIFFREADLQDPMLGALGAQQVQLTPRRSLAVDRSFWPLGMPVWLDTSVPAGEESPMQHFRQLLIAQDTGSAITGPARADVYWGFGEDAGRLAGPMKSPGEMYVLLPCAVADELRLPG
jgi:membrane-bound lytic murein transglycosylase A